MVSHNRATLHLSQNEGYFPAIAPRNNVYDEDKIMWATVGTQWPTNFVDDLSLQFRGLQQAIGDFANFFMNRFNVDEGFAPFIIEVERDVGRYANVFN